jgi:hypothetical protein
MQKLKLFLLILLPTVLLVSCSNGNAGDGTKSASADGATAGASTGSDMYYEYTSRSNGATHQSTSTMKLYVSDGGGVRMEIFVADPTGKRPATTPMMVLIADKSKPNQSITIDDDAKAYTINNIDSVGDNPEKAQSTATKIGEEKLLDYNCVHARVISQKSLGSFANFTDTIDLWKSADVPLQPFFRQYMNRMEAKTGSFMYSPAIAEQLKQMGCVGFQMKMEMRSKDVSMTTEVTKVQKGDFPKSMFEIPAGYKEIKD